MFHIQLFNPDLLCEVAPPYITFLSEKPARLNLLSSSPQTQARVKLLADLESIYQQKLSGVVQAIEALGLFSKTPSLKAGVAVRLLPSESGKVEIYYQKRVYRISREGEIQGSAPYETDGGIPIYLPKVLLDDIMHFPTLIAQRNRVAKIIINDVQNLILSAIL